MTPIATLLLLVTPFTIAQDDELSRAVAALVSRPKVDESLDRLVARLIQENRFESILSEYEKRRADKPDEAGPNIVVGLFQLNRGNGKAAAEALAVAVEKRPQDAELAFAFGKALSFSQRTDDAIASYRKALELSKDEKRLLVIYSTLGRTLLQSQRVNDALKLYSEMETKFPAQPGIREQNAEILASAGRFQESLERYAKLAADPGQLAKRLYFRLRVAELKLRSNSVDECRADLEAILDDDLPDDNVYVRQARRLLEDSFLQRDELDKLVEYYRKRLAKKPNDLATVPRLAIALTTSGNIDGAITLLDDVIPKAPGKLDLRRELAALLVQKKQYAQAIAQYEALDKLKPNDEDTLRDWGRTVLLAKPDDVTAAGVIWQRMLVTPPDAGRLLLVAELYRETGKASNEAIKYYEEWIALDPTDNARLIRLGHYFLEIQQREKALATWNRITAKPAATAKDDLELARTLLDVQMRTEAVAAVQKAMTRTPLDPQSRLDAAEFLAAADAFAESLAQLEQFEKANPPTEKAEIAFKLRLRLLERTGRLTQEADALDAAVAKEAQVSALQWYRLARYREAERKWTPARAALAKALAKPNDLGPALPEARRVSARLAKSAGDISSAIAAYKALFEAEFRADDLAELTRLAALRGDKSLVKDAAAKLVEKFPASYEHHVAAADCCRMINDEEARRRILELAGERFPGKPEPREALAKAWSDIQRYEVALEKYWEAFTFDDRTARMRIVVPLAQTLVMMNRFDDFPRRSAAILGSDVPYFHALAYVAIDDFSSARQILERLLADAPEGKQAELLLALSGIADREGDTVAAIEFERRRLERDRNSSKGLYLTLLLKAGRYDDAAAVWRSELARTTLPAEVYRLIDGLIFIGQGDVARPAVERLIRERPKDWEAHYRLALLHAQKGEYALASRAYQALLDLADDDDRNSTQAPKPESAIRKDDPMMDRLDDELRGRIRSQFSREAPTGGKAPTKLWIPHDFGTARMAAIYWQNRLAEIMGGNGDRKLKEQIRNACDPAGRNVRAWRDRLYLAWMTDDREEIHRAAMTLMTDDQPWLQTIALAYLESRLGMQSTLIEGVSSRKAGNAEVHLGPEELDKLIAAFRNVMPQRQEYVLGIAAALLAAELKYVNREVEAKPLWQAWLDSLRTPEDFSKGIVATATLRDVERSIDLMKKVASMPDALLTDKFWGRGVYEGLMLLTDEMVIAKNQDALRKLIDAYLDLHDATRSAQRANPERVLAIEPKPSERYTITGPDGRVLYSRTVDLSVPSMVSRSDEVFYVVFANLLIDVEYAGWVPEFVKQMTAWAQKKTGEPRADALRLLAAVCWWQGDKAMALEHLRSVCEADPMTPQFRLDLALICVRMDKPDEARAALASIIDAPLAVLKQRDLELLRLAAAAGNAMDVETLAARLQGMNPTAKELLELVKMLRQVHRTERAASIMTLVRQKAGRTPQALFALMTTAAMLDDPRIALEIAGDLYTVLANGSGELRVRNIYAPSVRPADEAMFTTAITRLKEGGKLPDLIRRAEAQAARMPANWIVRRRLVELHDAANDRPKALAVLQELTKLRPDDPPIIAGWLRTIFGSGRQNEALKQALTEIRRNPKLFRQYSATFRKWYTDSQRLSELAAALEPSPLTEFTPASLARLVRDLAESRKPGDHAVAAKWLERIRGEIEAHANTALATETLSELSGLSPTPDVLAGPLWEVFHLAIMPRGEPTESTRWDGADWRGRAFFMLSASRGRAEALQGELQESVKKYPGWHGGELLLALLEARRGQREAAQQRLSRLLELGTMPASCRSFIAGELQNDRVLAPIVLAALKPLMQARRSKIDEEAIDVEIYRIYARVSRADGRNDARDELLALSRRARERTVTDRDDFMLRSTLNQIIELLAENDLHAEVALCTSRLMSMSTRRYGNYEQREAFQRWGKARDAALLMPDRVVAEVGPRFGENPSPLNWGFVLAPPEDYYGQTRSAMRWRSFTAEVIIAWLDAVGTTPEVVARLAPLIDPKADDGSRQVLDAIAGAIRGDATPLSVLLEWSKVKPRPNPQLYAAWFAATEALRRNVGKPTALQLMEVVVTAVEHGNDARLALVLRRDGIDLLQRQKDTEALSRWIAATLDRLKAGVKGPHTQESAMQGLELAVLAAQAKLMPLSRRALTESLGNGKPTAPATGEEDVFDFSGARQLPQLLGELSRYWNMKPAPEDYLAWRAVVLPPGQPGEANDYTGSSFYTNSLFNTLIHSAKVAGRSGELLREVTKRRETALAASVLELLLALQLNDAKAIESARLFLREKLQAKPSREFADVVLNALRDSLNDTAHGLAHRELATLAVMAGAGRASNNYTRDAALDVVLACVRAGNAEPAAKILDHYARGPRPNNSFSVNRENAEAVCEAWCLLKKPERAWQSLATWYDTPSYESTFTIRAGLSAALDRGLEAKTPKERYEILKAWVVPEGKPLRDFTVNYFPSDDNFRIPHKVFERESPPATRRFSAFEWLLVAARDAGTLPDLRAALGPRMTGDDGALSLFELLKLMDGDATAIATWRERVLTVSPFARMSFSADRRYRRAEPELVFARVARQQKSLSAALAEAARSALHDSASQLPEPLLGLLAELAAGYEPPTKPPRFRNWRVGDEIDWLTLANGAYRSPAGSRNRFGVNTLTARLPLAGDFEIRFEATPGASLLYGGVRFYLGNEADRYSANTANTTLVPYRFVVQGDRAHFTSREYSCEPTKVDPAQPWLSFSLEMARSAVRNLELLGNPKSPQRINLLSMSSPGWAIRETLETDSENDAESSNYDRWVVDAEELRYQRTNSTGVFDYPATISYPVGLLDGESFTYSYFHETGKAETHPLLGQVVFVLQRDGIDLHSLRGSATFDSRKGYRTVVTERRGSRLPFKEQHWNTVRLTRAGDTVRIELNGELVYVHTPQHTDWRCGVLRDKDREARMREIAFIPVNDGPCKLDFDRTDAVPGEQEFAELVLQGRFGTRRPISDAVQFERLKRDVMPVSAGGTYRLSVTYTANGPTSSAAELAALAVKLKRVPELLPKNDSTPNAKAWMMLLSILDGQDSAAALMDEAAKLPAETALILGQAAVTQPSLRERGLRMLKSIAFPAVQKVQQDHVRRLIDQAEHPDVTPPAGPWLLAPPAVKVAGPTYFDPDETTVPAVTPPGQRWTAFDGGLWARPGAESIAYFASPLGPQWTLRFELRASGQNWPSIEIGDQILAIRNEGLTPWTRAEADAARGTRPAAALPLVPRLDPATGWTPLTLTREGATVTLVFGDRKPIPVILERAECPWLLWRFDGGGIRNVQLDDGNSPAKSIGLLAGGFAEFNVQASRYGFEDLRWVVIDRNHLQVRPVPYGMDRILVRRPLAPGDALQGEFLLPEAASVFSLVANNHTFTIIPESSKQGGISGARFKAPIKPGEWHVFSLERTLDAVKLVVKDAVLHTEPATGPTVYGFSAAGAAPARMRNLKLQCSPR